MKVNSALDYMGVDKQNLAMNVGSAVYNHGMNPSANTGIGVNFGVNMIGGAPNREGTVSKKKKNPFAN